MFLEDEFTFLSGEADPARRAEFRQLYTEKAGPMHVSVTRLFPGALELLTALKRRGIPTGIVSTKKTATIRDVAEARGITPLLSSILGGDQVSAPKPDPEGLLASLTALGLEPHEVLFCGDTVIDGEAARRLGAVTIGSIMADFDRDDGPQSYQDNQRVAIAGVISAYRTRTTRNNTLMAYVTLEDGTVVLTGQAAVSTPDGSAGEIAVGDYIQGYAENPEGDEVAASAILITTL